MKRIAILFLAFALLSCSSNSRRGRKISSDEFADIENSDFIAPAQVRLNISKDIFEDVPDVKNDILAKESLARIPEPKLKGLDKSSDPLTRASARCRRGDIEDGLRILDKNYRSYKKNASYWNQIGTCYFLADDFRKATLYYNKSKSMSPSYAPPINNLGVIYQRRGIDQKALIAYKKAAKLSRFSITPLYNKAQLYLKYGFVKKAKGIFSSLRSNNPNDATLTGALATCYLMMGDTEKALSLYRGIDEESQREAYVGINYALALHKVGQLDEARSVFSQIRRGSIVSKRYYNKVRAYVEN